MATHSSTLAQEIPWMEEPGGLQSSGEELDTTERLHFHFSLSCTGEGNGNPLQCSCLENPRDGSLVGCCLWGHTESDTTDVTQQQQQQQQASWVEWLETICSAPRGRAPTLVTEGESSISTMKHLKRLAQGCRNMASSFYSILSLNRPCLRPIPTVGRVIFDVLLARLLPYNEHFPVSVSMQST